MASRQFQSARIRQTGLYGFAALAGIVAMVSGCADGDEPIQQDNVATVSQAIINGAASGREHDEVVVLANFKDGVRKGLCSATMVAPNLLLTARHCVSDAEMTGCTNTANGASVKADRTPENLIVFVGKNGLVPSTAVEANGSARGVKLVVEQNPVVCNNDIAFLVLDKHLDTPIAPIRLAAPKLAERLVAVGWGIDETGQLPRNREMRGNLSLLGIGPSQTYGDREFMVGESACSGDSGGPAFAPSGAVIGVASRAGNGLSKDPTNNAKTCVGEDAHAIYTQLGAHRELVTQAFSAAGEPIWLEGDEKPTAAEDVQAKVGEIDPAAPGPAANGCSMSSTAEPQKNAVESAAGIVALLATLVGLRRRFGKKKDEEQVQHLPRKQMPSIP